MRLFGSKEENEINASLKTAKAAVRIVDSGIRKEDLSLIPEKLEAIPLPDEAQEIYIFCDDDYRPQINAAIISGVLALIFAVLFIIGCSLVALTDEFELLGTAMMGSAALALLLNIGVIMSNISKIRFARRFIHYYEHLKYHRIEAVDDLSEISGYSKGRVVRDLKKAISKKYIPEGHFGRNDFIFMVSNEIFALYQQRPAVFDHYFMQKIEERERMRGRNAKIQRILDAGNRYIERIHDSNDLIQDKGVSGKLDRMEKTVSMIFREVDLNPRQAEKLGMFLNYYLPTTEKLLKTYIEITEKGIESKSLTKTQQELARSLDTINSAFEKILEQLYVEQEADVLSDIETMETMMTGDGLVD